VDHCRLVSNDQIDDIPGSIVGDVLGVADLITADRQVRSQLGINKMQLKAAVSGVAIDEIFEVLPLVVANSSLKLEWVLFPPKIHL